MENEKIYRIPKNLNADFTLLACYTIPDVTAIFLLFAAGFFSVYWFRLYAGLLPSVVFALLRLRIGSYTLSFWLKTALQFLMLQSAKHSEYTLFEKEDEFRWR